MKGRSDSRLSERHLILDSEEGTVLGNIKHSETLENVCVCVWVMSAPSLSFYFSHLNFVCCVLIHYIVSQSSMKLQLIHIACCGKKVKCKVKLCIIAGP